jgi:hypothetical protein
MTGADELRSDVHSVSISALTNETRSEPTSAVQFAVRDEKGNVKIFGDQEWIRYGAAAEQIGGSTIARDVTVSWGNWYDVVEEAEPAVSRWRVFDEADPSTWPASSDHYWVVFRIADGRPTVVSEWWSGRAVAVWAAVTHWMPVQKPEPPQ